MKENIYFMSEAILPDGFKYPKAYSDFVAEKSNGAAMIGMPPWVFASNEDWALEESENIFGKHLVPFAQAINMDMLASFVFDGSSEPAVWLTNPWDEVVLEKFDSFGSWLKYALELSQAILRDNPHVKDKKTWFPT